MRAQIASQRCVCSKSPLATRYAYATCPTITYTGQMKTMIIIMDQIYLIFFFRIFLSDCCVFVSFGFCSPHQAIACCRFWMHIAHCHRLDSNKCGNCEWHVFHLPTALHQHCTALVPSYRQSSACISHAASCPCECVCFPCLYNRIRVHDVFQLMDKLSIFVLLLPLPSLTLPPLSQLHLMLILLLFLIA